jgi:UDP-sulfoquinovose synthase
VKIIVLGADGYLGWPTCMYLKSQGHSVIAVDNYLKRRIAKEAGGEPLLRMPRLMGRSRLFEEVSGTEVLIEELDVRDYEALDELFGEYRPDAVVHYAEQPSGPYSMIGHKQASLTLDNNVRGTLNLVHAIMNNCPDCHIVKLGTMGEYGTPNIDIEEGWLDVEHNGRKDRMLYPRAAGSFYHTTKILDTDLLWFYVRMKNIRVTDLMQGPVYGIVEDDGVPLELGTHFHYDAIFGTVLNRFVVQAAIGHPLTVYGKGGQTRGYIDLRDTVQCVGLALETPADPGELRIMNQFTEQFSALEIAERVREAGSEMGLEVRIDHIENPRIEAEDHYYNAKNSKLTELGLKPHPLTSGTIVEMIEFVQRNKDNVDHSLILPNVRW